MVFSNICWLMMDTPMLNANEDINSLDLIIMIMMLN